MVRGTLLRGGAGVVYAVMIVRLAAERRIMRVLRRRGATAPDSAIAYHSRNPIRRWRTRALLAAGVLIPTADGRLWLDADAAAHRRRRRQHRALAVLLALATLLVAWFIWRMYGPGAGA